ncbi:sensor histidine kinase [Paenibacillus tengchongensis]|uniref:sensor histidine kinase n=1 Tax=Paenibacillus tengchongensis TaxID=2608684 RepID=UPI00124E1CAE|nr:ATP-binding protein [Paenibacillus tengchongensis]
MEYLKIFFVNTAILITLAYLANLIYKHTLSHASQRIQQTSWVVLAIFAGWISSLFGYRLDDHVIFDLRVVPLMISTLAYPHPFTLILIGIGIGLMRLTFGFTEAAWVGVLNLSLLGFVCAALSLWIRRSQASMSWKGFVTIVLVNVINVVNIAAFGVIPAHEYITKIMPITLPAGFVLSLLFAMIIRDFHLEHMQRGQIIRANRMLSAQTEELHKNKLALEERAQQLMLASQYKSQFLANMSHELRTPLNSIINLSQLIKENEESLSRREISEFAGVIQHSGEDLLALINDILDLSKVEAGKLDIMLEELNVSEIPELLALQFDIVAKQKKLDFIIALDNDLPATITTDPKRVQQILRNLLANSFKFTETGSVELKVRTEEHTAEDGHTRWLVFDVSDTGIGIAPEKHSLIFEMFQQADPAISRRYGGTGLGLSISSDLARLLGGFITLQSEEGTGSRFSLYLPY